jgi:hypothetical protein
MLVHDIFHVSLLHPYAPNTLADQIPPPPPITIVDGNVETDVETILDSRTSIEVSYSTESVGSDSHRPKTAGNPLNTLPMQKPSSQSSITAIPTNQRPQRIDGATAIGREVNDS